MADQPPIKDKESWKKIGNTALFFTGAISFLIWLFNGPLRPDPNVIVKGRQVIHVAPVNPPPPLSPFADWMLHDGLLIIGLIALFISIFNFMRWKKAREAGETAARPQRPAEQSTLPINKLKGRLASRKQADAQEIEWKGKKVKVPALRCDVATLLLPGDHRIKELTWDKVIGQQEAKIELKEFLDFLQNPAKYARLKARVPRGVLMHGAAGVGKTLLARTLASLCQLPVIEIGGSEFVEMFVGVGASRVRLLFEDADELVKIFGGVIIFIDEFDGFARVRGSSNNTEADTTLNQFLKEMDGLIQRPKVFTIAATNRKDTIDPAAMRPGRFDRHIEFFNPNRNDRQDLLALYLPEDIRAEGLDLKVAAKAAPGASGAHLENIANEAKILTARAGLDRVTQQMLDEAVLKVLYGPRREGQRSVLTEMEVNTVMVHEAGHALVYMKISGKAPLRFTMVPRGQTGGHVAYADDFETLITEEHLKMRLAVLMGGAASTAKMRHGQKDSGVSMDVQMATDLAIQMVTVYGMSELGMINLQSMQKAGLVSEGLRERINAEVLKLVEEGKRVAFELVDKHEDDLKALVTAIEEHETLLEPDIKQLFNLSYEDAAIAKKGGSANG
jgi:cell division protease FtsH